MSASYDISWLNYINVQMNRYFPLPFVVFGTIGLILNMIIFTRRSLCNNSCVQYLLYNSLSNLIVLYWVVITRIVSDGYGNDLSLRSDIFCKIRYFLTYYSRTLATWFIVLACIDRWLSSIQAKQRFNRVSFARRMSVITCLICFISYVHVLFLFGIQIDSISSAKSCYALAGIYRFLSDLQYLLFYALVPPILMFVFGILTLRNIRRRRRLIIPTVYARTQLRTNGNKRRDTQLLIMLLIQVLIIIVFTLPFAIQKLVDTFSSQTQQTPLQKAQYSLLIAILRLLSYGSHALGFFFYTLSARIFRNELLNTLNRIYRFFTGKNCLKQSTSQVMDGFFTQNDIDGMKSVGL
ncbi:unnamed protein product [Adineta ricciae]|uniref:G-protein coupled receptors family 1 profile domain-containing protein n=1 Tax=Adineta ricciae TaxID=249248 RepID=A0A813PSS2_ADIRI|nr:unnamed protein product [Adineta ricciae]CAF0881974.1 unnamed protein product [Adineta ricciae]